MGQISAPSYANIIMARFEETFVGPYINSKALLYIPYTDDICMILRGTEEELGFFINNLNK